MKKGLRLLCEIEMPEATTPEQKQMQDQMRKMQEQMMNQMQNMQQQMQQRVQKQQGGATGQRR